MDRTSVMIQNSIASDDYQPNPAFRQNAAPHARMRKNKKTDLALLGLCSSGHIEVQC